MLEILLFLIVKKIRDKKMLSMSVFQNKFLAKSRFSFDFSGMSLQTKQLFFGIRLFAFTEVILTQNKYMILKL